MVEQLRTLINFHAFTTNQQAVKELLDHVADQLTLRGLHIEQLLHNGVYSLYASTTGKRHAKVMLQSHVDVVPGGDDFHQDGDIIYGRGCYDMLFAVASFLALINELDDPSQYNISLLLTGDEETGGKNGTEAILKTGEYGCDVCILPDAGDGLGALSVGAKGIYGVKLRIDGAPHHASRPWEGDGAAGKAVHFLCELSKHFDASSRDNSTLVVTQLETPNTSLNQAPGHAYVGIDIRYKNKIEFDRIHTELQQLMKEHDVSIVFEDWGRHYALDTTMPLVKDFLEIYSAHVNGPIREDVSPGSSDARYFDDLGIPVIMFRPDGGNAHGDTEWLSASSWQKFHAILRQYVLETARL